MILSRMLALIICLTTTVLSIAAENADSNAISSDLWMTKTFGTWKNGTQQGYYRALVFRRVGEAHNFDEVVVQLLELEPNGHRKLIKSIPIPSPGYRGYVVDVSFVRLDDARTAVAIDIEMSAMGEIVLRDVYIVSPKGRLKQVVVAGYKDIANDP